MTLQRICKFSKYFFLATFLAINVNLESHSRAESYSKILLTTDKNNYEVNIIGNFKYSILLNLVNKGFLRTIANLKAISIKAFCLIVVPQTKTHKSFKICRQVTLNTI